MDTKIGYIEDYLDKNLKISFNYIDCGINWIDIHVASISWHYLSRENYNAIINALDKTIYLENENANIKFCYDISGYDYFYNSQEDMQLFITIEMNDINIIDDNSLDNIINAIYSLIDNVNNICKTNNCDFRL